MSKQWAFFGRGRNEWGKGDERLLCTFCREFGLGVGFLVCGIFPVEDVRINHEMITGLSGIGSKMDLALIAYNLITFWGRRLVDIMGDEEKGNRRDTNNAMVVCGLATNEV